MYDDGTFYFVYFKGFTDDSLDELDFVEENLVFFCQTSQHECFALLVELTSKWEKLSQDVDFIVVALYLTLMVEQHVLGCGK